MDVSILSFCAYGCLFVEFAGFAWRAAVRNQNFSKKGKKCFQSRVIASRISCGFYFIARIAPSLSVVYNTNWRAERKCFCWCLGINFSACWSLGGRIAQIRIFLGLALVGSFFMLLFLLDFVFLIDYVYCKFNVASMSEIVFGVDMHNS